MESGSVNALTNNEDDTAERTITIVIALFNVLSVFLNIFVIPEKIYE